MSALESSGQEKLSHLPISQLVTYAAKQHLKDYVCRDFNKVEWCSRDALVKSTTTALAPKHVTAQVGFPQGR